MESYDLSVIIPTASSGGLLPMALAHLEVQTYPAACFEVLVTDYGNPGEVASLIKHYISGAPIRVRYLRAPGRNYAEAANSAIEQAEGHWLLFLDEELLAGPRLVEEHITAQQLHGGEAAITGTVDIHPQVAPYTLTKWGVWREGAPPREEEPLPSLPESPPVHYLDWRTENLSLPRRWLDEVGGFSESDYVLARVADLSLAARLHDAGLAGFAAPQAVAYAWRATDLERERRRIYARGYGLYLLDQQRSAEQLSSRLLPSNWWWRSKALRPFMGLFGWLCVTVSPNTRLFALLSRHVLQYELSRGFCDSAAGRPPRYAMGSRLC